MSKGRNFVRHSCRNIVAENGNIVAKNSDNVETTFDIVERIVQLVAFDDVASTLLLVWTGFNTRGRSTLSMAVHRDRTCANAGTVSLLDVRTSSTAYAAHRRRRTPMYVVEGVCTPLTAHVSGHLQCDCCI